MQCSICSEQAIIDQPLRCKEHFVEEFEQRVKNTIEQHQLIKPSDRIAVAVSGGKDSLTVLTLIKKWYDNVSAIAIDEGIAGYREQTLEDAKRVCAQYNIPLIIKSFKELSGFTLDEMLKKRSLHPCTVCGALRRHLLATASKEFDVLATGHNADDEAQAVLMNIIKGNTELFTRLGPISGNGGQESLQFTRRVKPLYFCTEKEVMTYAFIKGLTSSFGECPNIHESYRHIIRDELNRYAQSHDGVRTRILERFLLVKQEVVVQKQAESSAQELPMNVCETCGEPSSARLCKACEFMLLLRDG